MLSFFPLWLEMLGVITVQDSPLGLSGRCFDVISIPNAPQRKSERQ